MSKSVIEICNIALSNIRAASINDLNEPSLQAQQCRLKYEVLRDRCLREIPWQFNRKVRPLALLDVNIDGYGWAYAYSYPADCLKIRSLLYKDNLHMNRAYTRYDSRTFIPGTEQVPYQVFNVDGVKVLATNLADAQIDFSAKMDDPTLFSDDFVMALAYLLSSELAIPIVGAELGRALRSDSLTMYKSYIDAAIAHDMDDQYLFPNESDLVTIRS